MRKQTDVRPEKASALLVVGRSPEGAISVRNTFIRVAGLAVCLSVLGVVARRMLSEGYPHQGHRVNAVVRRMTSKEAPQQRHGVDVKERKCSREVRLQPIWIKANDHFGDQTPEKAIDGDVNSKWHTTASTGWLSFALAPGQAAALTRVKFNMSEKDWSARWPGHITVYGYNVTAPLVYSTNGEAMWSKLWSSSPQWNGATGISVRPSTSEAVAHFNAFKLQMRTRYPHGKHGLPENDLSSNRLSVHEMELSGTLPNLMSELCSTEGIEHHELIE
jgi:hypothetical protein